MSQQSRVRECPKCHQMTFVFEPAGYVGRDAGGSKMYFPASWGCSNCDYTETIDPRDTNQEATPDATA